jgi:SAM-dependent methyltransferase
MTDAGLPVAERVVRLFKHLGIERAHVAAAVPGDWRGLATGHPDLLASLSLVCPAGFDPSAVSVMSSRVLVFHGDRGPTAERVRAGLARVPEAELVTLPDYPGLPFADVAAERGSEIGPRLLTFIKRLDQKRPPSAVVAGPGSGEVARISYRVEGSGPPLVLLPLSLAPSQWDPVLLYLREQFCTIVLGGPHLGIMPILEARGQAPGYLWIVRNLLHEVALRPGEKVLEAGCGSAVIARWLARHTQRANPITAVDINRYLLGEADSLVGRDGLHDIITLREGNAEALRFSDNSFDVALSVTVMEEGDADQMLTELRRVIKPGGRVAAIVRGDDCPALLSLPLHAEVHAKAARAVAAGVVEGGCADSTLYRRFHAAGLTQVRSVPQFAVYDDARNVMAQYYQSRILSAVAPDEAEEWRAAVALAERQGFFVLGVPHHCAVGTKP